MPESINIVEKTVELNGNQWMRLACATWSNRLAQLMINVLSYEAGEASKGVQFLIARAQSELAELGWSNFPDSDTRLCQMLTRSSPMGRLAAGFGWSTTEINLVVLAGLPEIHEGYADLLRMVSPEQRSRTATGLAAQLICNGGDRSALEASLHNGPLIASGALLLEGDGPLFSRSMVLAEGLWSMLNGIDVWPATLPIRSQGSHGWGLEEWVLNDQCDRAKACLQHDDNIVIRVQATNVDTAINRATVLADHSNRTPIVLPVNEKTSGEAIRLFLLHCYARGAIPVFAVFTPESERGAPVQIPDGYPGAMLVANGYRDRLDISGKALLNIHIEGLEPKSHVEIWRSAIPELGEQVVGLASRFPVEPHVAAEIARDLSHLSTTSADDVGNQIRARAGVLSTAGINLVTPKAGWSQLVLPHEQEEQLREAVQRLNLQSKVLDQWGFLKSRSGARGVRILLAGAPGTGKTLSAEVLANELGVDLLIVDISRVVSKWIGETEKNLEQAFEAAERSKAVLLFDEADALFGKRTEVSDAHDRYANLETAYLLTRLERFEGLAVMSTNMRNNIDPAFLRRMEYIVNFNEPGKTERHGIWQCHVPKQAPMCSDVDFGELAAMFPVVGGTIRNAAAAAAFRAAAQDRTICRDDFVHALKREYEKHGKAFPAVRQSDGLSGHHQGEA